MYPELQYFLQAYCTLSLQTEEVWNVIEQFKKQETKELQEELRAELQTILHNGELTAAREIIREQGHREFSIQETEKWLSRIVKSLREEKG